MSTATDALHVPLVRKGGLPVGATNGVYGSNVGEGARSLQLMLDGLEDALYGLSTGRGKSTTGKKMLSQARYTYLFERQLLAAHQLIADTLESIDPVDREGLLYRSVRMLRDLQYHTGRLFEVMIRTVDVVLPGPNGLQIPRKLEDGTVVYEPNYRTCEVLSAEQRAEKYKARLNQFLEQKGDLSEMKTLDEQTFQNLESGKMIEYVELADSRVRVSAGTAGHLLLSEGKDVKSAGQILVMKDPNGRCTLMYVTNASGSYKPDLLAAQHLCDALCVRFGVPHECAIVSKGMPADTQTYKILLKAGGETKEQIEQAMARLSREALSTTSRPMLLQWADMVQQKREAGHELNALQLQRLEQRKQRERESAEERAARKALRSQERANAKLARDAAKAAKKLEREKDGGGEGGRRGGGRGGRGGKRGRNDDASPAAATASATVLSPALSPVLSHVLSPALSSALSADDSAMRDGPGFSDSEEGDLEGLDGGLFPEGMALEEGEE